ncbi:MAG: type II-A CRISPR-associated protein Csn2, partial [Coriobacteriales bacterium]|jgi:CRISPR type II-A-associated protein Csn2|nr:type II-A CRISPR-associated protein Csn2 [Coriobacteriales bacterium]
LSHEGKELALDGNLYIVFEPYTLDPNVSRTVFNKLIASLKATAFDEDHLNQTNELMAMIERFNYELLDAQHYSFEITAGNDFSVEDLLKALKPHIELPDGTLSERIVDYLAALRDLYHIQVFVLMNFSNYLSVEQLGQLVDQISCDGHHVLFVENRLVELDIPHVLLTAELCEL